MRKYLALRDPVYDHLIPNPIRAHRLRSLLIVRIDRGSNAYGVMAAGYICTHAQWTSADER